MSQEKLHIMRLINSPMHRQGQSCTQYGVNTMLGATPTMLGTTPTLLGTSSTMLRTGGQSRRSDNVQGCGPHTVSSARCGCRLYRLAGIASGSRPALLGVAGTCPRHPRTPCQSHSIRRGTQGVLPVMERRGADTQGRGVFTRFPKIGARFGAETERSGRRGKHGAGSTIHSTTLPTAPLGPPSPSGTNGITTDLSTQGTRDLGMGARVQTAHDALDGSS